jgi:hypothetical protein
MSCEEESNLTPFFSQPAEKGLMEGAFFSACLAAALGKVMLQDFRAFTLGIGSLIFLFLSLPLA